MILRATAKLFMGAVGTYLIVWGNMPRILDSLNNRSVGPLKEQRRGEEKGAVRKRRGRLAFDRAPSSWLRCAALPKPPPCLRPGVG